MQLEINPTEENRAELIKDEAKLVKMQRVKQAYWQQKASMKWFYEGDRNTKFFHAYVKGRRKRLQIQKIENEKRHVLKAIDEIGEKTERVFQKKFKEEGSYDLFCGSELPDM